MSGSWQRAAGLVVLMVALAGCGGGPGGTPIGEAADAARATVQRARVGHLQAVAARDYLASHPEALVLDVRNPDEWNDDLGHIEGARQIPLPELAGRIGEIEAWKERPVVAVCRSGSRSRRASEQLVAAGFREVMNLEGGMIAWRQAGD